MEIQTVLAVFEDGLLFFLRLLPYLAIGIFIGSFLEIALSRYQDIGWLKRPGFLSYAMVSLVGIGTPL